MTDIKEVLEGVAIVVGTIIIWAFQLLLFAASIKITLWAWDLIF